MKIQDLYNQGKSIILKTQFIHVLLRSTSL